MADNRQDNRVVSAASNTASDLSYVLRDMYTALQSSLFYEDMRGITNPETMKNRIFYRLGYTKQKINEINSPGHEMELIRSIAAYMSHYHYLNDVSADSLVNYFMSLSPITNDMARDMASEKLPDNAHYADMDANEPNAGNEDFVEFPEENEIPMEEGPELPPPPTDDNYFPQEIHDETVDDTAEMLETGEVPGWDFGVPVSAAPDVKFKTQANTQVRDKKQEKVFQQAPSAASKGKSTVQGIDSSMNKSAKGNKKPEINKSSENHKDTLQKPVMEKSNVNSGKSNPVSANDLPDEIPDDVPDNSSSQTDSEDDSKYIQSEDELYADMAKKEEVKAKAPLLSPDKQFEIKPGDTKEISSVKSLDRDFFKDPDFLKRYSSYAALGVPDGFNDDGSIHFKSVILGGASALYILKAASEAQKRLDEKVPVFKGKIRKAREIVPPVVVELEDGLLNGLPVSLKKDASIIHLPAGKAGRARDFVLLSDIDKEKTRTAGLKFPSDLKDKLETSLMKYNRREPAHFDTFMYEYSNLKKRMAGNAKDYTDTFSKALKYSDEDKKILADFAGRQFNHAVFNKLLVPPDDKILINVEEKTENGIIHKQAVGRYVDQRLVYAMEKEAEKKAKEQGLSGDEAKAFVSDVVKAQKEKYSLHLEKEFQDIRKQANSLLDMPKDYKDKVQDVMSRHPDFLLDASRLGSVYTNLYTAEKKEAGHEFDREREYFCKQAHVDERTLSEKLSDSASLTFDKEISHEKDFKPDTHVLVGSDVSRVRFLSALAQTEASGPVTALPEEDKKYLLSYRTAENLRKMKGILIDKGMEDSVQFGVLSKSFEEAVKSIPPESMERIGRAVSNQAVWDKEHPSLGVSDVLLDEAVKYKKAHEKKDDKEKEKDTEIKKDVTDTVKKDTVSFKKEPDISKILSEKNPRMVVSDSVLSRDSFKVSDISSTVLPRMTGEEKMNVTSLKSLLDEKVKVEASAYMYGYETQQILDTPYLEEITEKEEKAAEIIDRKMKTEVMLERLSSNDVKLSDDFYNEQAEKYKKVKEEYQEHVDQLVRNKKEQDEDIDQKLGREGYYLRKTPEYHKSFDGKNGKNKYKNGRSSPEYDKKKKYEQGRSKKDEEKNKGMSM